MSIQCFMYLRKSTESDEKQKASIEDQGAALKAIAAREGLSVLGDPIEESKSARSPNRRPLFREMMRRITNGEANAILVWSVDRLARNPVEGGEILWMLTSGKLNQVITPSRVYTSSGPDKLTMFMEFALAANFIDNLSANVKRAIQRQLSQGRWPSKPKLGYVRDRETKLLIPDPERFHLVQALFKMKLDRAASTEILDFAHASGLRTPIRKRSGGKPINMSRLYRILHDPFYAGLMVVNAGTHPGVHQPMVTMQEFEQVQQEMKRSADLQSRPKVYTHTLRGMIQCGSCGAAVTSEKKISRHGHCYLYYHCARKCRPFRFCPEPAVEEDVLLAQAGDFLASLDVPEDVVAFLRARVREAINSSEGPENETWRRLTAQLEKAKQRLAGLRTLCADGRITEAEFDEDRERALAEQVELLAQLEKLKLRGQALETFDAKISFAKLAKISFDEANPEKKRQILKTVCSKHLLQQKNLLCVADFPFSVFSKASAVALCSLNGLMLETRFIEQLLGDSTQREKSISTPECPQSGRS